MIVRQSVADIDTFSKAVVKNGVCEIRVRNGEPVIKSVGKNDLDAIRKLRKLLDQLHDENIKPCESEPTGQ
jgi:hypothetical protein